MSRFFVIHSDNPQSRLIKQAAKIIQEGGVVIYPTDSTYAMGCQLMNKNVLDRMRMICELDEKHYHTIICRNLSELATYAYVDNAVFRILKAHTPGPYTFILKATHEVPRRLLFSKCKTIGLRIPDNKIVLALLSELNKPLVSMAFIMPEQTYPWSDANDIYDTFANQVDLVIDGGSCGLIPTTVVDLTDGKVEIVRVGKGDPTPFV